MRVLALNSVLILSLWMPLGRIEAIPSDRPLPQRLVDENRYFEILRDHEIANQFYLLPKTIVVSEIQLEPFGKQQFGCQAVDEYLENLKLLVESRKRLAQVNIERLETLNELVISQRDTLRAKSQVRGHIELINEQISIEQQSLSPNEERLTSLQQERSRLEEQSKAFDQDLKLYQEMRDILDQEQEKILKQTDGNEKSAAEFSKQVARAAAQANAELRIESLSLNADYFRVNLGFRDTDIIMTPQIIGLNLRPDENLIQDLNFLERNTTRKEIGIFSPSWSQEAIPYQPAIFEDQTEIPTSATLRRLPSVFRFSQTLSLLQYCRVLQAPTASSLMLGISYRIPLWIDSKAADSEFAEVLYHSLSVDEETWQILETLPTSSFNARALKKEDPGDPSYFGQEGKIVSRNIDFELIEPHLQITKE